MGALILLSLKEMPDEKIKVEKIGQELIMSFTANGYLGALTLFCHLQFHG